MTRQEIFDKWMEHVSKGMGQCRDKVTGTCLYYDKTNGNMCAIGSLMKDPEKYADFCGGVESLFVIHGEELKDEPWFQTIPDDVYNEEIFLCSLQSLHDTYGNWRKNKLKKKVLEEFKKDWGLR